MKFKEVFYKISDYLLFITSLLYLLITFIIWDVNYYELTLISSKIYDICTFVIIGVLVLNYKRLNLRSFLNDIFIFILIIIILTINSFFIPLGVQSRELIYQIIPVFLLVTLLYRMTANILIKYGLYLLLGLFTIYNILGIIGAIFRFDSFLGIIDNPLIDNYRYQSILDNPNALGEYAYLSIFIITFYMIKTTNLRKRIFYFILFGITGMGLIVSASRNAILMVGIIYFVLLFYYRYLDKQILKIFKYLNIIGVLIVALAFIVKTDFMIGLFRLNQGLTGRTDIWKYIINGIKENFIFGVGYGNSGVYIYEALKFDVTSSHNMYLGLLWEMGVIAFLILILWMIKIIISNHKLISINPNQVKSLIMYNGFYISFFIGQFFEFSFFKIGSINTFVFIIFALNIMTINSIKKASKSKIKVTHLITGLDNGGAESMLYKILKNTDTSKFELAVISMADEGFYGERIKQLGIKVVTLNLKKPKFYFSSIAKLFKTLNDTDVLQTWLYHANLFGLIIGKLFGIKRIIWGIRQSNVEEENNKKLTVKIARISAKLSRFVTNILSCSDEATKVHIALGYKESKFKTIYNGFELEKYYLDKISNLNLKRELGLDDEFIITNVARWDIQKDHRTLFKAINILYHKENVQNIKLILCGIGMNEENLELMNLINENNIEPCVKLLGVRSDINKIMSLSDIFVLSSLGEGFPNVLGEAMACNCGVVTTDVGDCKAIVGDCGIVVPKQNPELLAQALKNMLNLTKDELVKIGEKARLRIVESYDIKTITKQYEELYV